MPFSYNPGSATPTGPPGLVETTGLRLSDGTFRPQSIPPLVQSPPLRITSFPAPFTDGGLTTWPLYDVWQFDLTGWLFVDEVVDVQAAIDYLFSQVNRDTDFQTWSFYGYGWGAAKTMTCRLAGQISVSGGDEKGVMVAPSRQFVIPLITQYPVLT